MSKKDLNNLRQDLINMYGPDIFDADGGLGISYLYGATETELLNFAMEHGFPVNGYDMGFNMGFDDGFGNGFGHIGGMGGHDPFDPFKNDF